jgi:hypothetical protein
MPPPSPTVPAEFPLSVDWPMKSEPPSSMKMPPPPLEATLSISLIWSARTWALV